MTSAEMTSNIAIMYICMSNMNKMPCRKKLCITLTACGLLTFNMSKMNAQTNCVIADMETRIPIRNVKVFTNRGDVYVTDYTGQLHIDKPFESATLSHVSYLERKTPCAVLKDTVYLLPKSNELNTLYVWGKDRQRIKSMVLNITSDLPAYAPAGGVATFDFFEMFRKKPFNKKVRKKNEELLKNWDTLYGKVEEKKDTIPTDTLPGTPPLLKDAREDVSPEGVKAE